MHDSCIILPVTDKPPITVYKNYSYPLCIISTDASESNWLCNHFGNIYLMRNRHDYIWLDFLEPNDGFDSALEFERINLNELEGIDIISLIQNTLNEKKYVTLFLDEYYMDKTALAGKKHHLAEFFIYGYDDEKRIFYTVGFNSSEFFGQLTYSYNAVIKAHDSFVNDREKFGELPVWVIWYAFSKIKKKENIKENSDIKTILCELEEYASSTEMNQKLRSEIIEGRGNIAVYGADCQNEIIKSLYEMLNNDKFYTDYRHVHLLYEHKKIVLEKMRYIENVTKADVSEIIDRYKSVMKKTELAKVFFLKAIMSDNETDLYDQLKNKPIISKIIKFLEDVSNNEPAILLDFISKVKECCN